MLMVAITSHFVDNDFVYHEDLLSFRHVPTSHTGKNLAAHVYGILHEFNIHTKLFCITTDSASNNGEMMKELSKLLWKKDSIKWNGLTHHIRCLAHVINLAVKAFLLNLKIAPLSEEHHWIANRETSNDDDERDDGEPTSDDDLDDDVSSIDSNSDNDDDIDDDDKEFNVENTQDFKTVLHKVRTISKAATVTQKRILSFNSYCQVAKLKSLRPIRDHAIRWSAAFNMLERALYLKHAIDMWTRSEEKYEKLQMNEREWEMVEFLVRFLYPFMIASTTVQATKSPSLADTWVVYEELFDSLDYAKDALNGMTNLPDWLREVQSAIEATWKKLRKYYDKSAKPFAYIDATILHPALKNRFFKSAGYSMDLIDEYTNASQLRFQKQYDPPNRVTRRPLPRGKRRRPAESDSESSEGADYNEFTDYIAKRRDKSVTNMLSWWKNAQAMYPKLSKMARDVMAVPATGAGVEREFSISGRVVTKQRNSLKPSTICDLMQYKRWVVKHGITFPVPEEEMDIEDEGTENELDGDLEEYVTDEEDDMSLSEWVKNWEKKEKEKEKLSRRLARLARAR